MPAIGISGLEFTESGMSQGQTHNDCQIVEEEWEDICEQFQVYGELSCKDRGQVGEQRAQMKEPGILS